MNLSIPFKKVIPFKGTIEEICSISLEHDVSINDKELLGDFIISGEYKNLEINVDTKPFEHVIPFSVNLDDDILIDTLNYEIEDFNYEIINNDSLSVNIILHVTADKKEINKIDEIFTKDEDVFVEDDVRLNDEIIPDDIKVEILEENINTSNDNLDNTILNNYNLKEDYITYHIHLVKINETLDSISSEYKIDKEKLIELNDVSSVEMGDKLIIPDINE